MTLLILAANLLGWPLIHLAISFMALRLPSHRFAQDSWLTAPRRWERDGRLYRDWLAIRKWKSQLPDGAPWLGGAARKKLKFRDATYLAQFLLETRRAEWAHWSMLCCLPLFFLWNPPWACLVMTAYALAANLPCIFAQRYNRITLERVVRTRNRAVSCV
jgi:glycosyl-4,4'-diaponeurosporenoate acyltransferase